jgi:putative hydrolase of HD superfamily
MARRKRQTLLGLFAVAGRLKQEPRRGWVLRLHMDRPESVADHSYRVALMAMVYSDLRKLDAGKAMRMALLHDLPEALVGDSIPGERTPPEKRRLESAAMSDILKDLPPELSERYHSVWHELEEGKSAEAKLVKELDKVELAIQADEYRKGNPTPVFEEFIRSARSRVDDPELLSIIDSLARP